jgi:hypothetical protein
MIASPKRRQPYQALSSMKTGRFPPPWSAEVTPNCFIVRDANGQALSEVYYESEPWAKIGGEAADQRRGAADRGQYGEVAGTVSSNRLDRLRLPLPAPAEQT